MAKRYIDAEEFLKDQTKKWGSVPWIGASIHDHESLPYALLNAPTADVAEVKHSMWKLYDDGSGCCKICNYHQKAVWDMDGWQEYCGHCGAKMDGERRTDDGLY